MLVLFLVLGAAVLFVKLPEIFLPMGEDQGLFNYGAQIILGGGKLYRDFWETKPPLEYLLRATILAFVPNAWGSRCFVGPEAYTTCGQLFLHAFDYLYTIATALVIYAIGRGGGLRRRFAWAGAALASTHMSLVMLSQEGNTPEKHLLLPLVVAVWCAQRVLRRDGSATAPWIVLAGVAVAGASLFKPPALIAAFPFCVFLVLGGRPGASPMRGVAFRSLLVLTGILIGLAPVLGWLASDGLLDEFWEQAVLFNLGQASSQGNIASAAVAERLWEVFARSSALLWLLALGGITAIGLERGSAPCLAVRRLWGLWAIGSVVAVFAGGSKLVYSYFLYPVPAFALLGGYLLQVGWDRVAASPAVARTGFRVLGLVACATVLTLTASFQRGSFRRMQDEHFPRRTTTTPEEVLVSNTEFLPRRTSLYIWGGQTQVYVLSSNRPPTRHLHPYFLSAFHSKDGSYMKRRGELLRDLKRAPPAVILLDQRRLNRDDPDGSLGINPVAFPALQEFLAEEYELRMRYGGWDRYNRISHDLASPDVT